MMLLLYNQLVPKKKNIFAMFTYLYLTDEAYHHHLEITYIYL